MKLSSFGFVLSLLSKESKKVSTIPNIFSNTLLNSNSRFREIFRTFNGNHREKNRLRMISPVIKYHVLFSLNSNEIRKIHRCQKHYLLVDVFIFETEKRVTLWKCQTTRDELGQQLNWHALPDEEVLTLHKYTQTERNKETNVAKWYYNIIIICFIYFRSV